MEQRTLTNNKINSMMKSLDALSKPHNHSTSDGKTYPRDFDIPPRARWLLMENMSILKNVADDTERQRLNLVTTHLPLTEDHATPEELGAFQKAHIELFNEKRTVNLHTVYISDVETKSPDTIDLTKAPIPMTLLCDLIGTIIVMKDAPNTGNSEAHAGDAIEEPISHN